MCLNGYPGKITLIVAILRLSKGDGILSTSAYAVNCECISMP